jgi:hypothetical protein
MLRIALGIIVWCIGFQVSHAQTSTGQLAGKYWLYLKENNLKTEEYFEIKPDGASFSLTWPDQSICRLVPDAGNAYHLECHNEKLQIVFEETPDKKIKGFVIVVANERMYGLKE